MKFHRVYVELTNICGLQCSFCPPKIRPTNTMSLSFFEHVLEELRPYTKELAYHIVGDPLALSNLEAYLDITHQKGFRVSLTTSGYYLNKHALSTFLHPAIKQINFSLNSYNKNQMPLSFEAYMEPILKLCALKNEKRKELFINLRVWNMDEAQSEKTFNAHLFTLLEKSFSTSLHVKEIYENKPKSIRLDEKILLHFDEYFEWPTLDSTHQSQGTCQGMDSHFGILADGTVVPCCLDKEGVIALGDLHVNRLKDILTSSKAQTIRKGFKSGCAVETLCQKCLYKERFKEKS